MRLTSYFKLADLAAAEYVNASFGLKVGAVVVDPVKDEVIAVAGDARWFGQSSDMVTGRNHRDGLFPEGRPEHHALMRAIAIVANKEAQQKTPSESSPTNAAENHNSSLANRALNPLEKLYAASPNPDLPPPRSPTPEADTKTKIPPPQSASRPNAYLCHGLDIYLTHEPCVACSMAMIHSRFRTCIFRTRMPKTGGLCAEKESKTAGVVATGLGYGLFWRRELNWRVLTFQYLGQQQQQQQSDSEDGAQRRPPRGVVEDDAGFNA
jgi:tRNA-specific adenosine deaminase 3